MATKTRAYTISPKAGEAFTVRGKSYQHAAEIAARKLAGRRATANRTSGVDSLSGWFQGYIWDDRVNASNSRGPAFHVA